MTTTALRFDGSGGEEVALDRLSAEPDGSGAVVWVDIDGTGDGDEAALRTVAERLGLHGLAVEDAHHRGQRPKLDLYRGRHLFLTVYAVDIDDSGVLTGKELGLFVTRGALVTVHDGFDMGAVRRRWDEGELTADRVGVLLHGLLDLVADGHLLACERLDDRLEELEDLLFEDDPDERELHRRAVRLRRSLADLRRLVLPMREVLVGLGRVDGLVDHELEPYFADVRDHEVHAADWTDSMRELVNTIRETQLAVQGNRLNLIMKKVTGWAAIIAIPTAITGFYGQNVPYPGYGEPWGVWVSTAAIVVLAGGLYAMFRGRDWL